VRSLAALGRGILLAAAASAHVGPVRAADADAPAPAAAASTVRLAARDVRILYYGDVEVGVESADGAPHRVRVRVQTPAGLQAPDGAEVDVPTSGRVAASVRVWRSSAPRGSRQPLIVVAEPLDGATPAASQEVTAEVLPDPAWMPRLRRPLGVLALLLMTAAALMELRRGSRARG
jgi:hypothetical protein